MIYIIGDTHCPIDIKKLNNDVVFDACGGKYPDYVIITGDAGFIWSNNPSDTQETFWLEWIGKKPWITLFVDGNHENHARLNCLPTVNMFMSSVGQVHNRLFHLKRGYVYTIDGKKIFTMGGATSTDKMDRIPYVSWWPEEVPSYADFLNGVETVNHFNNTVDYVISHTAPTSIMKKFFTYSDRYKDSTSELLEAFINLKYDKWFFGHMHDDVTDNDKFICTYNVGHII